MADSAATCNRTAAAQHRRALLIYDDSCPLCTGIVARLPHKPGRLRYRPRSVVRDPGLRQLADRTVVLWWRGRPALRSTALIEALLLLVPATAPLATALLIPRPMRDTAYHFIARHRYRIVPGTCPAR